MHTMLVRHLEEKLAAGAVDPDHLVTGDAVARRAYTALQQQWMATPLPDGRVPMDVLLDEQDAGFLAEWAAADSGALTALQEVLDEVGERPLSADQLATACGAVRAAIARNGLTGRLLTACGGADERALPGSDTELWVILAAGVVSPAGGAVGPAAGRPPEPEGEAAGRAGVTPTWLAEAPGPAPDDDEADEVSRVIGALCALEHVDWLAAVSALARGGPGRAGVGHRYGPLRAGILRGRDGDRAGVPPDRVLNSGVPDLPDLSDLPDVPGDLGDFGGRARISTSRPSRSCSPTSRACGRSWAPPTRTSA